MESDTFLDWFQHVFLAHTTHITGPKLLILDGHISHISLEVVRLAMANEVHMICLPPHSTHILQPLDVAVFAPMKAAWHLILEKHNSKSFDITKVLFPVLLKKLVENNKAFQRRHAVAGFETCGIYPFNPQMISDDKLKTTMAHMAQTFDNDSSS